MTNEFRPIGVCGDWHGSVGFSLDAVRAAAKNGVRTMVHVGDMGLDFPGPKRGRYEARLNRLLVEKGVTLIVSPGNHDNWDTILKLPVGPDGLAVWRSNIPILPRGGRTVIEGLTVGGLGGGYSVDQHWRTVGKDWWADEEPTQEEADKLVAGGPVDVLVTHDVPSGISLTAGDFDLAPEVQERANQTRLLLRNVVDTLAPPLVFSGHWHQRRVAEVLHGDSGKTTTVHVLADENSRAGNAVLLWPDTLKVEPLIITGT
ncbi:MAG TPA: metallophosphoesterase [Arthrobacter sp.]